MEMKIKTTVRYHYIPIRMNEMRNRIALNAGKGVEKLGNPTLLLRM